MTTAISDAGFQFANGSVLSAAPRSYLSGLTLSTAGSSNTMSIAAGMGMDSTNATSLVLASAISKTTGAWAVGTGNGGLDSGTIANSTWYYYYLINNPITGVTDVIFSTSSSAPTLPSGYTLYRYIGGGLTNGSAQWTSFTQFGDTYYWGTPVLDFSGTGATSRQTLTCSIPRGRKMLGLFNLLNDGGGSGSQNVYLSDLSNADLAPSSTVAPLASIAWFGAASAIVAGQAQVYTNTSAQIGWRSTSATAPFRIATLGWIDLRGKDL
jgi:hypothetical protein